MFDILDPDTRQLVTRTACMIAAHWYSQHGYIVQGG